MQSAGMLGMRQKCACTMHDGGTLLTPPTHTHRRFCILEQSSIWLESITANQVVRNTRLESKSAPGAN